MEYRYTAIILKKRDVNETDRLYTFYTREAGKVTAIARGVRKPEAKLAGQLETLMLGGVIVAKGKGKGNVTGAIAEEYFPRFRTDEVLLPMAMEAVGTLERMLGEGEADEELFRLITSLLFTLEECAEGKEYAKARLFLEGFFFHLLSMLGYRIEAGRCAGGGEPLVQGQRHSFNPEIGGIVCESHRGSRSLPVSENGVKLLRLFLSNSFESVGKICVGEGELAEIERMRKFFFQYILG
jgi:DNA repair protein RecO (recombination protein O)